MSSFRKTGATIAALAGLAFAGIGVAADQPEQHGRAGEQHGAEHGIAEHGKEHMNEMQAQHMAEMHKRMQGAGHRHQEGQKKQQEQKKDGPQQDEDHKHQ